VADDEPEESATAKRYSDCCQNRTVSDQPTVSVVVATHNRRQLLDRLVRALDTQEDGLSYEVVVVDDGSTDGTQDELVRLSERSRVRLVPVRMDANRGPAAARNAGWRRARAPLVAFTDDDCVPQPGWLAALLRALDDADVAQGRTLPDPDQMARGNAFSHSVVVEDEWGFYEACNMAYRRTLLEQLGGFDEGFHHKWRDHTSGPVFGEDTDLGWRAKRAGARIVFEPDALVLHDVRRQTYVQHLRQMRRREGVVRLVKRNPEVRELCHYRVFWRPAHPPALWAGIGLATAATARRRPWRALAGLALCAPYVRYRTHTFPTGRTRNRPVVIPLALLSDFVEIGVLAAASVRYRTLVL
jgi:glycosyltransferase involved in cell wall biosynthesis